jgi:hypothetical protein
MVEGLCQPPYIRDPCTHHSRGCPPPRQGYDSDRLCCNSYRGSYLRRGFTSRCPTSDTDPNSPARANRHV